MVRAWALGHVVFAAALWGLHASGPPKRRAPHIMQATRLLALLLAGASARKTLLVAYVGHDADAAKHQHIREQWAMMQTQYVQWTLRCLLVHADGAAPTAPLVYQDNGADACSSLALPTPQDDDLKKGHLVHAFFKFLGSSLQPSPPHFDFLLKAEMSTLVCFSMITDVIDSAALRYQGGERLYLGQVETCTRVQVSIALPSPLPCAHGWRSRHGP